MHFLYNCSKEKRSFQPPGKVVATFDRQIKVEDKAKDSGLFDDAAKPQRKTGRAKVETYETKTLKVHKVSATQSNFKDHDRHLQALLKFYIEGASFILVDRLWHYFLVYMDKKLVAYATTYEEFRKVPKAPVTISQVLVLPPY